MTVRSYGLRVLFEATTRRILCLLQLHAWGPQKMDEAGRFQTCSRCGKYRGSSKLGPDGYDAMPPEVPGSGTSI
jgi:hypothetical protein